MNIINRVRQWKCDRQALRFQWEIDIIMMRALVCHLDGFHDTEQFLVAQAREREIRIAELRMRYRDPA